MFSISFEDDFLVSVDRYPISEYEFGQYPNVGTSEDDFPEKLDEKPVFN